MADDAPPWEPPLAGTEVQHLLGALDRQRATFRWKADGLDAAGLAFRLPSSTLSLGGLLHHLARVESEKFTAWLSGAPLDEPWVSVDWDAHPHWEFDTADATPPEVLYDRYDSAVRRSRERLAAALADGGLDQRVHIGQPDDVISLRRILFDLVEEYGRHTGHADLLREALDGRTGEDPPWDFPGAG
ncbi:MAG TPA: mini-circle protein [Acidimicrobiaceae bacterium]|nr:mini-circle protein [Acidimicrobiaceae bacterium]